MVKRPSSGKSPEEHLRLVAAVDNAEHLILL
jgi:hypothetical protein